MQILKASGLSQTLESLKTPAMISSVLVIPFMTMELINRPNIYTGFPVVLFVVMWLLALSFMIILMPMLRRVPSGSRTMPNAMSVLPRIIPLFLIAWLWLALVLDQMPCFLGVPNCD